MPQQAAAEPAAEEQTPVQSEETGRTGTPAYPIEQFKFGTTAVIETGHIWRVQLRYACQRCERTSACLAGRGGNRIIRCWLPTRPRISVTWVYTIEPGHDVVGWRTSHGRGYSVYDECDDANGSATFVSQTDEDDRLVHGGAKIPSSMRFPDDGMSISLTLTSANVRESQHDAFRVGPEAHPTRARIPSQKLKPASPADRICSTASTRRLDARHSFFESILSADSERRQAHHRLVRQRGYHVSRAQNGDLDMTWAPHGCFRFIQDVWLATDTPCCSKSSRRQVPAVLAFNNRTVSLPDGESSAGRVPYALTMTASVPYSAAASGLEPQPRLSLSPVTVDYKGDSPRRSVRIWTQPRNIWQMPVTQKKNADGF